MKMTEFKVKLEVILMFLLGAVFNGILALDDSLLFSVSSAPPYFQLEGLEVQPMEVQVSEEYTDQDYFANTRRKHYPDMQKMNGAKVGTTANGADYSDEVIYEKYRNAPLTQDFKKLSPAQLGNNFITN